MKHPHPDRLAETYRRHPEDRERLVWIGYAADQPAGATWDNSILGWILDDQETP